MTRFLKIRFTGICTFVPHTDGTGVLVLMTDGRSPNDKMPSQICLCPVILFNYQDLAATSVRAPDLVRQNDTQEGKNSLCLLDRENLAIQALAGNFSDGTHVIKKELIGTEPDASTRRSWNWIAQAGEFRSSPNDEVLDDCLAPSPDPATPLVARMELRAGELATEEFLRTSPPPPLAAATTKLVQFQNVIGDPLGVPKAVAGTVQFVVPFEDNSTVRVASKRWDANLERHLDFELTREVLEIDIWNVPFRDVMQTWGETFPHPPGHGEGQSFKHHYRILKGPDTESVPRTSSDSVQKIPVLTRIKEDSCIPSRAKPASFAPLDVGLPPDNQGQAL